MDVKRRRFLIVLCSALFILLGLTGLFIYEYFRIKPNNVHFTNVTSNSVTVSWNTDRAIVGTVKIKERGSFLPFALFNQGNRFFDTRDVKNAEVLGVEATAENISEDDDFTITSSDFVTDVEVTDMGDYYTHHVTVTGLDPETEYSFMVGDTLLFRDVMDYEGNESVTTLEVADTVKSPYPAYGSVKDAQGKEDITAEELVPVTDAIVYFNYLDEFSGERSTIYSSSMNDSGNWYIDVSGAVGEDGEPFLDRFEDTITNILAEIVVDAGPLGTGREEVNFTNVAPVQMIVLNFPVSFEKTDSKNTIFDYLIDKSVIGVTAQGVGSCQSFGWCTWSYSDPSSSNGWTDCTYDMLTQDQKNTYDNVMNCSNMGDSEIAISNYGTCAKGVEDGGFACADSTVCKVCNCHTDDNGNKVDCRFDPAKRSDCVGKSCYEQENEPTDDTTISEFNNLDPGADCYIGGKKGTVVYVDQYENRCVPNDSTISELNDMDLGADCYVDGKKGTVVYVDQYENRCVPNEDSTTTEEITCPSRCSANYKYALAEGWTAGTDGECETSDDNYGEATYSCDCSCTRGAGAPPVNQFPANYTACKSSCEDAEGLSDTITCYDSNNNCNKEVKNGDTCPAGYFESEWECETSLKETQLCYQNTGTQCILFEFTENEADCGIYYTLDELDECEEELIDSIGEDFCGANARDYPFSTSDWSGSDWCAQGAQIVGNVPSSSFPGQGQTVTWTCQLNTATVTCSAYRNRESGEDPIFQIFCNSSNIGRSCTLQTGSVGICSETSKCVIIGGECTTSNTMGEWNPRGYCEAYTIDQLCWEGLVNGNLYKGFGTDRMRCKDGSWVPDPEATTTNNCLLGNPCSHKEDYCLIDINEALVCWYKPGTNTLYTNQYVWTDPDNVPEGQDSEAFRVTPILAGEKCTETNKCKCLNGPDQGGDFISRNQWCREVKTGLLNNNCKAYSSLEPTSGSVCSNNGATCKEIEVGGGTTFTCSGPIKSSIIMRDNNLISKLNFANYVLGQSTKDITTYIIDPTTGLFTDIPTGSYTFEYEGQTYAFDVGPNNYNVENGGVLVYIDENDNGVYDDGVDIKVSDIASSINILAIKQKYNYELIEGLNFVSFPFLISNEDYRTAASLLAKLNEVYNDSIYSISRFDGGQWKMVGQNSQLYDNNDFQLLPGVGYVIKAKRDVNISIVGQPVQLETTEDSSPIYFNTGWNLIGLYGTNIKSYTAKTLLEDINTRDMIAINVTDWVENRQMYEGFQVVDGEEYGFDYPLNTLESYFVRIKEGSGNWQPQIGGNN